MGKVFRTYFSCAFSSAFRGESKEETKRKFLPPPFRDSGGVGERASSSPSSSPPAPIEVSRAPQAAPGSVHAAILRLLRGDVAPPERSRPRHLAAPEGILERARVIVRNQPPPPSRSFGASRPGDTGEQDEMGSTPGPLLEPCGF